MQSKESRKESVRQFKKQKPLLGAYAVRCAKTGNVWVGTSRNLNATKNGCWFMLRSGSHQEAFLQAEWNTYGEPAFEYEILDGTDEEIDPLLVERILKDKKAVWVSRLAARVLP